MKHMIQVIENISEVCVGIDFGTTYSLVVKYPNSFVQFENGIMLRSVIGGAAENRFMSIKSFISGMDDMDNVLEIAAAFFHHLRIKTNQHFQQNIKYAVVTVPARFNQAQRKFVIKAATKGGWKVLQLLAEPSAAIVSEIEADGTYLVYDLGGGTFDLALARKHRDIIHIIETDGDLNLGGDLIDKEMATSTGLDVELLRNFRENNISNDVQENLLGKHGTSPETYTSLLADVCQKVISKTLVFVEKALKNQRVRGILCVGGASCIALPYLKKLKRKLIIPKSPSLSVALGAAKYAHNLQHSSKFFRLIDAAAFDIGIKLWGGGVEYVIRKNMPLPAIGRCVFTNMHKHQNAMRFIIVQGEVVIGSFEVAIAPVEVCIERIEVALMLRDNSLVEVHAVNILNSQRISLEFKLCE